jgi:monodehydroascorbate reductase (NADH)
VAAAQCYSYSSSPATWALRQRGGPGMVRLSPRRRLSVAAAGGGFDNENREWVAFLS